MNSLIIMLTVWVARTIYPLLVCTVLVTIMSAVMSWLVGGTAASIAGSLQFMILVLYIFVVQIHLMFSPDAADDGWMIALLPFSIRVALLIISTIVSGFALLFTAGRIIHLWLDGG